MFLNFKLIFLHVDENDVELCLWGLFHSLPFFIQFFPWWENSPGGSTFTKERRKQKRELREAAADLEVGLGWPWAD